MCHIVEDENFVCVWLCGRVEKERIVGKDRIIMRHCNNCVCENVDGTFQVIIGGKYMQWVE